MTLHYPFPRIETIDDVLPFIDDNFRVVEKDGLTFINYITKSKEVFPPVEFPDDADYDASIEDGAIYLAALGASIRRECRGLVFYTDTGRIASRPFQAFFNAGERDDVAMDKIDVSLPHQLLEKLDGSMIRPIPTPAGYRWGTKMGITDVGMMAEDFVAKRTAQGDMSYRDVSAYCAEHGLTPLFEFCSRKNRIIVDYPNARMVLLAVRHNVSGEYMARWQVRAMAGTYGCPVVDHVDVQGNTLPEDQGFIEGVHDLEQVLDGIRSQDMNEGEGKILVFSNGHAVKVKSDKYVRAHRAKDMMRSEMRLLDLFLNNGLDDLLPVVTEEDRNRISDYLVSFNDEANHLSDRIDVTYRYVRATYETKKDFALSPYGKGVISPSMKSAIFSLWDGKFADANEAARTAIANGMSSETKFASMKEALKLNTNWDDIWSLDAEDDL